MEALQISDRHTDKIHLVISDKRMPRMTGPDLICQMRNRRPGVKVLLVSGYADDSPTAADRTARIAYLQKPYTTERLVAVIREVLHGSASNSKLASKANGEHTS